MSIGLIDRSKFNFLFILNICFFSSYFVGLLVVNNPSIKLEFNLITEYFLVILKNKDLFSLFFNCLKIVSIQLILLIFFSFFAFSQPVFIIVLIFNSFCLGICVEYFLNYNFNKTVLLLILSVVPIILIIICYFLILTTTFNMSNKLFKFSFIKSEPAISISEFIKYFLFFSILIYISVFWICFNYTVLLKRLI